MSLLSIIVPVYNGSSHLSSFLASVRPLLDVEGVDLVLVNDGSTDDTGGSLDSFAAQFSSVKVLHLENGGQGRAKNLGAREAGGRYLWFVDVDDMVMVERPSDFISQFSPGNFDLLLTGFESYDVDAECSLGTVRPPFESGPVEVNSITRFDVLGHSAWNKIIRREIFFKPNLQFLEGRIHEDLAVVPLWLLGSTRISVDKLVRYRYGVRAVSSIHGNYTRFGDQLVALTHLLRFSKGEEARVGPSIIKELFFYSLPKFAAGLWSGCSLLTYRDCYSDACQFFSEIPSDRRMLMGRSLSLSQRLYVLIAFRAGWGVPIVMAVVKSFRGGVARLLSKVLRGRKVFLSGHGFSGWKFW
ncbi:MAG: glycosyltransferase [Stenotrophomonas sp.]|uniref:glycosyltransferase n=1 Tax=Stenotrophomonas sp. TaxID=69392 RepID=UPI003D6D1D7C